IELLEAFQDRRILSESVDRFGYLAKITRDYADVGQGLKSDADRAATEASLSRSRELGACERQLIASTRLARVLSIPMTSNLQPQDALVVPLELISNASDEASLIATGLATRPELKESQALVEAAFQAYQREKYAPFVPSLLLGFSTSQFGGGLGSSPENFGGRYDLDAMAMWETRNSGFTEGAIRKERTAQIQQANFAKIRVMDQVAQEVAEANVQINIRRQQLEIAKSAITDARASYDQNIDRIRNGQGLPIEALQSIHALEVSQRAYLTAVSNFNRAQIHLQWALGWPLESLVANGL
ncbi:MAG: TolC family protein, partial [Pirellula sp.]